MTDPREVRMTTTDREAATQYRARVAEQPGGLIVAQFHSSNLKAVETEGRHYLAIYGVGPRPLHREQNQGAMEADALPPRLTRAG